MVLLDISLQTRVIIGISGMVVLFAGFLVVFISNQRKKIQYHKNLQLIFDDLLQFGADRQTMLVALGGGVSENVTRPSGPTLRYRVCACAAAPVNSSRLAHRVARVVRFTASSDQQGQAMP